MQSAGFDGFFRKGRSRKGALRQSIEVTPEDVRSLLARGVNRRDDNREPIRELGWSMSLWSGRSDHEAFSLGIHCGCYSRWVGNNLALTLPPIGPHSLDQARSQAEQLFDVWSRYGSQSKRSCATSMICGGTGIALPPISPRSDDTGESLSLCLQPFRVPMSGSSRP